MFKKYNKMREFRNKSTSSFPATPQQVEETAKILSLESVDIAGFFEFRNRLKTEMKGGGQLIPHLNQNQKGGPNMDSELCLKSTHATLTFSLDPDNDFREIKFEDSALKISGLDICSVCYYGLKHGITGDISIANFELSLLKKSHQVEMADIENFVKNFDVEIGPDNFWRISFSPRNTDLWFDVSSEDDSKRFIFTLGDEGADMEDPKEWEIKATNSNNILVEALKFACLISEKIRLGTLPVFIRKLNFLPK